MPVSGGAIFKLGHYPGLHAAVVFQTSCGLIACDDLQSCEANLMTQRSESCGMRALHPRDVDISAVPEEHEASSAFKWVPPEAYGCMPLYW